MATTIITPTDTLPDLKATQIQLQRLKRQMEALEAQLMNALASHPATAAPRSSPLDAAQGIIAATQDLRLANGKLSANQVAKVFGVSLSQLASWLGRTRQALNKTPDADSVQDALEFFERVARLRAVLPKEGFQKWLRMPNAQLDDQKPLDMLARGQRQVLADLVEDMLTGAPT